MKRGGKLGRSGVVAIKVAKENLDLRFDIPTVGPETVKILKDAGVSCLAIEAGKTLVLDREEMVRLADKEGISIIAL